MPSVIRQERVCVFETPSGGLRTRAVQARSREARDLARKLHGLMAQVGLESLGENGRGGIVVAIDHRGHFDRG
jgi:hypothetical protein